METFEKIESIRSVGLSKTYDIEVEEDHSFIGNKTFLHNSSSRSPNFQNIPSHGEFAKLVKRQFVADKGCIYIKGDLNAAEIRMWANISKDDKLADLFRVGGILRKKLFLETDTEKREAIKKDIKSKGDVHRLNYSFFYGGKPEDVTDADRNKVKAVIFGVLYHKGARTLAEDLNCTEKEAQDLINKLFETYKNGGDWISYINSNSRETLTGKSPIGRVRHLGSYLHPSKEIQEATERRAVNSIVQGASSDGGYQGGRILDTLTYTRFVKRGFNLKLAQINTVHDSVEALCKIEHLPIALYLIEHSFTTMVIDKYKKVFDFDFLIEPELDFEMSGVSMGGLSKFEWVNLPERVKEEIEAAEKELGYIYTPEQKTEILRKFNHNYEVMTKVKTYEIKKYLKDYEEGKRKVHDWCYLLDEKAFNKVIDNLLF